MIKTEASLKKIKFDERIKGSQEFYHKFDFFKKYANEIFLREQGGELYDIHNMNLVSKLNEHNVQLVVNNDKVIDFTIGSKPDENNNKLKNSNEIKIENLKKSILKKPILKSSVSNHDFLKNANGKSIFNYFNTKKIKFFNIENDKNEKASDKNNIIKKTNHGKNNSDIVIKKFQKTISRKTTYLDKINKGENFEEKNSEDRGKNIHAFLTKVTIKKDINSQDDQSSDSSKDSKHNQTTIKFFKPSKKFTSSSNNFSNLVSQSSIKNYCSTKSISTYLKTKNKFLNESAQNSFQRSNTDLVSILNEPSNQINNKQTIKSVIVKNPVEDILLTENTEIKSNDMNEQIDSLKSKYLKEIEKIGNYINDLTTKEEELKKNLKQDKDKIKNEKNKLKSYENFVFIKDLNCAPPKMRKIITNQRKFRLGNPTENSLMQLIINQLSKLKTSTDLIS